MEKDLNAPKCNKVKLLNYFYTYRFEKKNHINQNLPYFLLEFIKTCDSARDKLKNMRITHNEYLQLIINYYKQVLLVTFRGRPK